MTRRVIFKPAAVAEMEQAHAWYEQREAGSQAPVEAFYAAFSLQPSEFSFSLRPAVGKSVLASPLVCAIMSV